MVRVAVAVAHNFSTCVQRFCESPPASYFPLRQTIGQLAKKQSLTPPTSYQCPESLSAELPVTARHLPSADKTSPSSLILLDNLRYLSLIIACSCPGPGGSRLIINALKYFRSSVSDISHGLFMDNEGFVQAGWVA